MTIENGGASLAGFAGDRADGLQHLEAGDLSQREQSSRFGAHGQALHCVHVAPGVLGQSHDDGETPIAFDDCADLLARKRRRDGAV